VPIVGNIPVVGSLFQLEKSTGSKTELYIVVTPHVVHRGEAHPELPTETH
jgi:general secretion pathway protein D